MSKMTQSSNVITDQEYINLHVNAITHGYRDSCWPIVLNSAFGIFYECKKEGYVDCILVSAIFSSSSLIWHTSFTVKVFFKIDSNCL